LSWLAHRQFNLVLELSAETARRLQHHEGTRDPGLRASLLANQYARAVALFENGSPDAALEWQLVSERFHTLASTLGSDAYRFPFLLANPFRRMAQLHLERGSPERAREYAERALDLIESAGNGRRKRPRARHYQTLALGVLGLAREAQGQPGDGLPYLLDAVGSLRRLAEADAGDPLYRSDLAEMLTHLGSAHSRLGERDQAIRAFQEAAQRAAGLANSPGASPNLVFVLGRSFLEQARWEPDPRVRCGLLAKAQAFFEQNNIRGLTLQSEKPYLKAAAQAARGCQ
jgi:tetratricopeptide (TPR) repeat protein